MNAKRKTYGVSGYMEWVALIECGKATVKVHFSGGSLTGYGVTPAEFTTQNPMTQAIIENSKEFKSGKIFLLREIEGTGKFKEFVRGQHANEGNHLGGQAATASAIAGTALDADGTSKTPAAASADDEEPMSDPINDEDTESADDENSTDASEAETVEDSEATVTADGKAIIDVTDLDDARDYLCENFGIARSSLRSNVSVYRAAEEHNIVFRGIE
jgi:predicted  nucleic acid-binding Zn-ribbon protein